MSNPTWEVIIMWILVLVISLACGIFGVSFADGVGLPVGFQIAIGIVIFAVALWGLLHLFFDK